MKNKFFVSVCAVVLTVALLMVGCGNNQSVGAPSNHSKYASALGLSKEEACKIIGIRQEEMNEYVIETFSTPLKAELAGQTFDVHLSFNALTEEEELLQIIYRTIYPDLSDMTVQAVDAIVAALGEQYGEPSRQNSFQEEGDPIPRGYTYWDLTETVSEDLSAYMKQLEAEYDGPAYYELELHITEDEGSCVVTLRYRVGVIPGK